MPDILLAARGPYSGAVLLEYEPTNAIKSFSEYNFPSEFTIHQSHSNQIITFSLPHSANIRLDIYTIQGKKIRTLVNGLRNSGSQEIVWDCRNDYGQRIGNGCYIVRLVANRDEVSRKLFVNY